MQHTRSTTGATTVTWRKRENLVPGLALLGLTAIAWAYTLTQAIAMPDMQMSAMDTMGSMEASGVLFQPGELVLFVFGWAVMMVAMMLPAALPLILLYRTVTRKRLGLGAAAVGIVALLAGYLTVWTVAGLPVYGYYLLAAATNPIMGVLPGLLLIGGGVYQFTALKQGCHTRCSNPLFFLAQKWKPGLAGAARLGIVHGLDCLGCCVGLMLALVALGMMQVAWMLTAAVIIFVEKTLPGGHRVARPLGVLLIVGGIVVLSTALLGGTLAISASGSEGGGAPR